VSDVDFNLVDNRFEVDVNFKFLSFNFDSNGFFIIGNDLDLVIHPVCDFGFDFNIDINFDLLNSIVSDFDPFNSGIIDIFISTSNDDCDLLIDIKVDFNSLGLDGSFNVNCENADLNLKPFIPFSN
jgi:hypothetical protein